MKIALVLSSPPGYSETFFNALIKGLKEQGHDVTLYTGDVGYSFNLCKHVKHPAIQKYAVFQIFSMLYVGLTLLTSFKAVKRFFYLEKNEGTSTKRIIEKMFLNASLLKFKGDWIHFGFATASLNREFVATSVGAKMAVSFRGYDINVYPLKHLNCYNLLWRQIDKVHSISHYLLNKAYTLGLNKKVSSKIIYPAVDMAHISEVSIQENQFPMKIMTIARFSWIKGLDLLIDVAASLRDLGVPFEWHIIGSGSDTEKERYLYSLTEKNLQQHLFFKGSLSHRDTLDLLEKSDLYVQTSLNEGFCNAVLEAQAMGLPCVAFRVGGLVENILDAQTGWLIAPFETLKMAEKIKFITERSLDDKEELKHFSRQRVQRHFNLNDQKKAFHQFYNEVIRG